MRNCFFSWDFDGYGVALHQTAEAARAAAQAALDLCRKDAQDGWPDGVEDIMWGEIRERVVETRHVEVPDGVTVDANGMGDDGVDYSEIPAGCDALADYALIAEDESRAREEDRAALDEVFPMIDWLLVRIGSWTSARWEQHLRDEFGDERAQKLIDVLATIRARGQSPGGEA